MDSNIISEYFLKILYRSTFRAYSHEKVMRRAGVAQASHRRRADVVQRAETSNAIFSKQVFLNLFIFDRERSNEPITFFLGFFYRQLISLLVELSSFWKQLN